MGVFEVLSWKICAAIANWRIVRNLCLEELIHSYQLIAAAGDEVATGSVARQSDELVTNAFIWPRLFGCCRAALRVCWMGLPG